MGCCSSTADDIAKRANVGDSMQGKVAIVTGANTGIGKYTAYILAKYGVHVILAGRDMHRLEAAASDILAKEPLAQLTPMVVDLSSLASVRDFVEKFVDLRLPLHLLINNAAVMAPPYRRSPDGFELQLATNHLGPFLLTELLIPTLKANAPARIVNVSSRAHSFNKLNLDRLSCSEADYNGWVEYGNSKACNALHALELSRRLAGTGVTAYSLHPGSIGTDLGRNSVVADVYYKLCCCFQKSIAQGAHTTVFLAMQPGIEHLSGNYFSEHAVTKPSKPCADAAVAARLYEISLEMVGLKGNQSRVTDKKRN